MVGGRSGGWRNLKTRSPTGPRFRRCCLLSYSFNVPKTLKKKELATPMSSAPSTTSLAPLRSARTRRRRPTNPTCTRKKVRRENKTRMTATGTGVSVEGTACHSDARAFERTHSLFKRKAESAASAQLHGHTSTQRQLPPAKKRKKKRRTAD